MLLPSLAFWLRTGARGAVVAIPLVLLPSRPDAARGSWSGSVTRDTSQMRGLDGPRVRTVDIKHIALELTFDWTKRQAAGTATLTLAPLRRTDRLSLDAGMLTIESVKTARGQALSYAYDGSDRNDALAIVLERVYAAHEPMTIAIRYRTNWVNESDPNNTGGSTGKGLRFFGPTTTEPVKRKQLWSYGEPIGNRYWFPGYDAPDDLRTTEIVATVPAPLMAIANGELTRTTSNADGTRTFVWRMDRPYANYQTSIAVGEYVDVRQEAGATQLHSYAYPDERDAAAATVVRLPEMVRFFSEKTGVPYPLSHYSQVFVQDIPWGSGHVGASTLTENMVDDEPTHADYRYLWDGLEAEALAHQWFGGYVTARDWRHAWLNRGLARYFDALFNEYKNGRDEMLQWHLGFDRLTYYGDWANGVRHPIVPRSYAEGEAFASDNYPYARASLTLHMLRSHLGDETWWKAIKAYFKAYGGTLATTADFQRAMEEASGESLGWFFDQWVYAMGHPVFEVSHAYDASLGELKMVVKQTQKPDTSSTYPQVEYFQGSLDLALDGDVERVWLSPQEVNTYAFKRARAPKVVNFDYEQTWISEVKFPRATEELAAQLLNDPDLMGRQRALTELRKIAADTARVSDRTRAIEALRIAAERDTAWRVRLSALTALTAAHPTAGEQPIVIDTALRRTLERSMRTEKSWVKAAAITLLGNTRDRRYVADYIAALRDISHPSAWAAGAALGKTKSPKAFAALAAIRNLPSWKGENMLTALNGLKELGDPRGVAIALEAMKDQAKPRWYLAVSRWDYRLAGAETLKALGRADLAYPLVRSRLEAALKEDDVNDVFANVQLLATLGDPRASDVFAMLKERYKTDANAVTAVDAYETMFKAARGGP